MIDAYAVLLAIVLPLAGVLFVNWIIRDTDKERPCKNHGWVLDMNAKLICIECGYRPGNNQ